MVDRARLVEARRVTDIWRGAPVLVTGGAGFIGSHLVERLLERGARVRTVSRHPAKLRGFIGAAADDVEVIEGDLRNREIAAKAVQGMQIVMHLAAAVAGVGYNMTHPGSMLTENADVGLPVLDAAARGSVERFLCVSSACVYQRACTIPTPESEGFDGDPEPTNFGYGWAKRMLEVAARGYAQEFPMAIAIARPYNAYGPRDNFDPATSHVVPALIRKVLGGDNPVTVWGDGSATRSFLYVDDFVAGLIAVAERHAVCDPVNIGTDEEISIRDLIALIVELSGAETRVVFDTSKPGGQPRRNGDFSKAATFCEFQARTPLREGIAKTLAWYRQTGGRAQ
jgi:GDP-L-fucose synthase